LKDIGLIVTAKIRLGFKNNNVIEVSKKIEEAGADLLTIHARTAQQRASDKPDWSWISKVKKELGISIVGNGGVINGKSASEMLEIADGAMIASAAIGNPFVFREILRYLRTGKEKEITKNERIGAFKEYLKLAEKYEVVDMSRIKYVGSNFFKGFDGASKLRSDLMKIKNPNLLESLIRNS
jgi:tRNA-dihydrouridine synthase